MTRFKTKLTGIAFGLGLTLSLVALPLAAGATEDEATASYGMLQRSDLEQIAGRGNLDVETIKFLEDNIWFLNSRAGYAMAEPTELERIAGRRNLDVETITFLEENLWIQDDRAGYAGGVDLDLLPVEALWFQDDKAQNDDETGESRGGVYDINLDMFSDEIPWQDYFEPYAGFAGQAADARVGVYDIDLDMFSDEIPWQDRVEPSAGFAEAEPGDAYPESLPPGLTP